MARSAQKPFCQMSVDEILSEAISRESALRTFYTKSVCELGPEVCAQIRPLIRQTEDRILALERLRAELTELRDLTTAMAD